MPADPFVTTVVEMAVGGTAMVLLGSVGGEWGRLDVAASTPASWIAFAYLVLVGSVVAYSAYVWLLARAPLSLVTTYAYVNPAVAVGARRALPRRAAHRLRRSSAARSSSAPSPW